MFFVENDLNVDLAAFITQNLPVINPFHIKIKPPTAVACRWGVSN